MKTGFVGAFCAGLIFAGAAASAHAADKPAAGKAELALPSMQLGDYALKLATDEPHETSAPEPLGLRAMRDDDQPRAFLGFSLSRPLPDHFWDFAR
jgi:hypothetical protein